MTAPDGEDSTPDAWATRDVPGDAIDYRQPEDEDGIFEVRMPIATTGEVRNEGDDPLTRDELDGMRQQIESRSVPVFLDHGGTNLGGMERYSAIEKVGEWAEGEVRTREADDDTDELVATARMMDPETLPSAAGALREALAAIKEQVQRDMSLASSIAWREDDAYPGGNDLMEASIVGIGADPRTTSQDAATAGVVARAAVDAGADPDRLVAQVRAAVDGERPLGPPEDPERFDSFEECVNALQEDEDLSREEAERICGSWETAKDDQSHDMTDDESSGDESDTTDDEQDAGDGEQTTERAFEDVGVDDFDAFVAAHQEGADPDEVGEALNEVGEWVGQLDRGRTAALVATATDASTDAVQDAFDDLLGEMEDDDEADENEGDGMDDDEEDDESEQDADADGADDPSEEVQALREDVADLRESLAEVREGGVSGDDVDRPEPDGEQDSAETDTDDASGADDWRAHT